MRRLWVIVVTTALLCFAGARLAAVVVAPIDHHSSAARPAPPPPAAVVTSPRPVATETPALADPAAAAAAVTQAARAVLPDAEVGFEVFDQVDGRVLTSYDADRQFAAMSVVKLLIALDAVTRDNGTVPSITQGEIHQMLANSDDQIANQFWSSGGGPAIVNRVVSLLGLTDTSPPEDPGEWGDTLITPQDIVIVYRYITTQLPQAGRDLILDALAGTPRIAADGFDQYFGIPDGMANTSWAVKQGWGTSGSQAVMNSTGLVGSQWRYVVVVLACAPANSYSRLPAVATAGAGALASVVSSLS